MDRAAAAEEETVKEHSGPDAGTKGAGDDPGKKLRVLSVDKVTVEKIVLESSNGAREVLLTKNESSRKLSVRSEPTSKTLLRRTTEERKESAINTRFRVSVPVDPFTSRLTADTKENGTLSRIPVSRQTGEKRIKPVKLTKSPSIGSIIVPGLKIGPKGKVPPKVPEKPKKKSNPADSTTSAGCPERTNVPEELILEKNTEGCAGQEKPEEVSKPPKEETAVDKVEEDTLELGEKPDDSEVKEKLDNETEERKEQAERQVENCQNGSVDLDAQDRLEKSQTNIEVLQQNLRTKINATTARKYKEKLLGLRSSYILKLPSAPCSPEKPVAELAFDQDFLERHNLDKRLKIEEKRFLETDLDYVSDGEQAEEELRQEAGSPGSKPSYSRKVSEIEKRWSGEFLEARLEQNSSGSSKSSYVEEFGSVSSRESVVEDRNSLPFPRKSPDQSEKQGEGRRVSQEISGGSTVSTVDSDSCLEDRIKAVDEDIRDVTNETQDCDDDTDDLDSEHPESDFREEPNWKESGSEELSVSTQKESREELNESEEEEEDTITVGINNNLEEKKAGVLGLEESIDRRERKIPDAFGAASSTDSIDSTFIVRKRRDGYANLIKEFTMEAGSSRVKKEEKQKKKLGLRRLLPGFFSPKDSRKDYKKKEQKERKKHDEKHFARYQQNGNYTRSPDTMNLNEDIKRNVKLDNSLNGSIIEERLDEIKRELFPDQGPITSTPDHFSQTEDHLREHGRPPRSYTTDSSLSSIAPDDRWNERNVQLGISPDIRKFEQRQKREELDGRKYGQLERKHSLQEPNHGTRPCFFQRNHGPSGRISAPPSERYLVRPRAIHPVDRPLPAIPHSRVELANYENYLQDRRQRSDEVDNYRKHMYIPEKPEYLNQPVLYENENNRVADSLMLKSVSAQVKITRQPIVNQNQRAPLVGRSPKYPSPGSSQKSGEYGDSSCTPNSSQKSEFSPTSSKSGEYYLHSPRNSGSPTERRYEDGCREGIYENEGQCSPSRSSDPYTEERVYDETPSSPCREKLSPKSADRAPEEARPRKEETFEPGRCVGRNAVSKSLFRQTNDNESNQAQEVDKERETQRQAERNNVQNLSSPVGTPVRGVAGVSPSSISRGSLSSRKSQPSDQILIASPKREVAYEPRAPRPSNESRQCALESPVPMISSPHRVPGVAQLDTRSPESGSRITSPGQLSSSGFPNDIARPEPIYGQRKTASSSSPGRKEAVDSGGNGVNKSSQDPRRGEQEDKVAWVQGQSSTVTRSPDRRCGQTREGENCSEEKACGGSRQSPESGTQRQRQDHVAQTRRATGLPQALSETVRVPVSINQEKIPPGANCSQQTNQGQQQQRVRQQGRRHVDDPVYVHRGQEPLYGQQQCGGGPLSPSKQETRQHLEAFYWQQKALEVQRKSVGSPVNANLRQLAGKIDLPEVREAMYWQQLKKLDEEQQRRIYEQNLMEEPAQYADLAQRHVQRMAPSMPGNVLRQPRMMPDLHVSTTYGDRVYWDGKMQRTKVQPMGKPPLMQSQKGQNQPVLIVRPQQAIRDRREIPAKPFDPRQPPRQQEAQRSKSASPHFHRGDVERASYTASGKPIDPSTMQVAMRKTDGPSIYEEEQTEEGKTVPTPIFKRGSLISGDSVEYGSTGPKRVSFSNQSNSQDIATGNWPTKHGTAPEPPTRRHRSEDSTSDTDSVFSNQDRRDANQECLYPRGNEVSRCRPSETSLSDAEYDANRPLPPPPKDPATVSRPGPRSNVYETRWAADSDPRRAISPTNNKKWPNETENGPADLGAMHRRNQEEEWNPDGKGRQSNDTGGSGRGEGELGSNELPGGRRGGGGGLVGSGVVGGGVLGVGGPGGGSRGGSGGGGRSRDEPRRHTLGGDHQPSLHHQQFNAGQQLHPLHPHHLPPPHGQYGTPPTRHTTMDLEMGTKSRQRKSPLPRGYPPPSSAMLFDDDPGIMSEVETSSTGFRRGGKQRSSLPVVRTPSKTLERPLGLVFLQYRNETKRALLPNEITSIDTVKALFVRSFPKQLTMEYLDSPHVKVYIHDSNKDMFYELEDLRSHLRDIRDRSVLRLFESTDGVTGMPGPLGVPGGGAGLPPHWEDQSYFSEPEFDSEYQHQHIHKSKTAKNSTGNSGYYVGGSSTLPRGGPLLRAYSPAASSVVPGPNATPTQPKTLTTPGGGGVPPAKPLRSYQCGKSPLGSLGGSARFSRDSSVSLYSIPDRLHGESGYMSSPERGGGVTSGTGRYPPGPYSAGSSYEDPYYSQYSGTVTPVIDEEASDTELLEESYSLYGVKPPGRPPSGPPRSSFPAGAPPSLPPGGQSYDSTRIRVEHMERQLANLTGLVQKALTHAPHTSPSPRDYLQVPPGRDPYTRSAGAGDEFDKHSSSSSASLPDDSYLRTDVKPPKLGKDKSVSFEKSVSFSDEPPDMNSPKQHSPQHAADTKPTKPAIKSSTLPRMSSQERDRHKPTPPPKPAALVAGQYVYRDLALTPEMYNQLRGLQKKAKDLRQEVRNLRRMSQAQAHTVRETIRDAFITIRAMLLSGGDTAWSAGDAEKIRLSREEDLYKQEMIRLEKDLTELESTVEELRGNVINRKTRVNMSDVENMALILSKSSKTVADLKVRFPSLQEGMKGLLSSEMEKVVREEKFLKEEPERLESALRRCKKLTGTLVTLKRLASVQEQRLPNAASVDAEETPPITPTSAQHSKAAAPVPAERTVVGSAGVLGGGGHPHEPSAAHQQRPENALDALLDELQTFSRPGSQLGQVSGLGSGVGHQSGSSTVLAEIGRSGSREAPATGPNTGVRAPLISDIGRKGSVDSSSGALTAAVVGIPGAPGTTGGTLRRLHSYPSSSDTDTSPPIARLQVSLQDQPSLPVLPQGFVPGQKPPVPERNAELLQLASARRVPPPPPPRTSSRSPLASPTSPQLPPRNHSCNLQTGNATLRRPAARTIVAKEGKPPMALPPDATLMTSVDQVQGTHNSSSSQSSAVLSTSNSSSCESVNSQEGLQSKRGRQEQLEQRHQELLRKQKALQEQYARLQQLQRNAAGLTTVPPAPPDLLKKTGSESNLLAKMGLGLSTASSGSLTSLSLKPVLPQEASGETQQKQDEPNADQGNASSAATTTATSAELSSQASTVTSTSAAIGIAATSSTASSTTPALTSGATTTTTSKIYETDIL